MNLLSRGACGTTPRHIDIIIYIWTACSAWKSVIENHPNWPWLWECCHGFHRLSLRSCQCLRFCLFERSAMCTISIYSHICDNASLQWVQSKSIRASSPDEYMSMPRHHHSRHARNCNGGQSALTTTREVSVCLVYITIYRLSTHESILRQKCVYKMKISRHADQQVNCYITIPYI